MGIFKKKVQLSTEEKMNITKNHFNHLMRKDKTLSFKFQEFRGDNDLILFVGRYQKGTLFFEMKINSTNKDFRTLFQDVKNEIDYARNSFIDFFGENVEFSSYSYQWDSIKSTYRKKLVFIVCGEEHSFTNVTEERAFIKDVLAYLSSQKLELNGVVGGRGEHFTVDEWDLSAFLHLNKGRKISIKVEG